MTTYRFIDLYPDSVLDILRKHLRKFWQGDISTVYSSYPVDFEYRQLENIEKMAENAVLNITAGVEMPGYNIPRLVIDFGTVSTASFWGGKIIIPEGGKKWIDPVIHNVDDVDFIKAGDPGTGDVKKGYELWKKVSAGMGSDGVPCTTIDLQGPLNTLSLLWEQQDFMMAMYDYPGKVHKTLEIVTEQLIKIIKSIRKLIPAIEAPLWPYIWIPEDIGIGITEDYMPLLSPELYKEFGIPYVKKLSDEFGGLFIHCCGQFTHHIENLAESDINIIGMEFVYPNIDIEKLFGAFGPKAAFVPNIMDKCIPEFGSMTGYFNYIQDNREEGTRLWYILRPDLDDFTEQVRLMETITDAI